MTRLEWYRIRDLIDSGYSVYDIYLLPEFRRFTLKEIRDVRI